MKELVVRALIFGSTLLISAGARASLEAQTLTLVSGTTSQIVPSPTAAMYDNPPTGNVTGPNTTTNLTVTAQCKSTGNPGCQLDLALGTPNPSGGALQVQWQLVSFVSGHQCGSLAVGGAFKPFPATVVSMSGHGDLCTMTFAFQVAGLSYATQPASATPYVQPIVMTVH